MASILIRQFAGQSVPPKSDAILYENATTGNGVIYGCNCTASDASTIHIDAGYGIIQGRFFEIEDQTISVTLAPSGTLLGQLYIHLDLSDADTPIDIYDEEAASLTAMTQQSGINYTNGIYEIQLCTFDVSTSTISNVVDKFPTLVSTATAISTLNNSNSTNEGNITALLSALGNGKVKSGTGSIAGCIENNSMYIIFASRVATNGCGMWLAHRFSGEIYTCEMQNTSNTYTFASNSVGTVAVTFTGGGSVWIGAVRVF